MALVKPPLAMFVLERHLPVPRSTTWAAALAVIDEAGGPAEGEGLTETVLSVEVPWRRVYELSGAPVERYEGTLAIQDHGPESHLVWGVYAELAPIGGTPDSSADPFLAAAEQAVAARVETIVDRAVSSA